MRKQVGAHLAPQLQVRLQLCRVYGSSQQFISYDFYENVIRYAISKNYLDTDLTS